MNEDIEIRRAVAGDLAGIARVVVDAWRSTFSGLVPASFLDNMSYDHQRQRHERTLIRPDVVYYLSTHGAEGIVGFASGGPTRPRGFSQESEVYAIYLLQGFQRRNIGSLLFGSVVRDLAASGRKGLVTFALKNNPNREFYRRLGGNEVRAEPLTLGDSLVDQVAYVWEDVGSLALKWRRRGPTDG